MNPKKLEALLREFDALQTVVMSLARQVDDLKERVRLLEERKK